MNCLCDVRAFFWETALMLDEQLVALQSVEGDEITAIHAYDVSMISIGRRHLAYVIDYGSHQHLLSSPLDVGDLILTHRHVYVVLPNRHFLSRSVEQMVFLSLYKNVLFTFRADQANLACRCGRHDFVRVRQGTSHHVQIRVGCLALDITCGHVDPQYHPSPADPAAD